MPPPAPRNDPPKPPASALSLMLAGVGSLVILTPFFFLAVMLFGPVLALVGSAIIGGLFAFGALHYLLWGWWLGNMIRQEEAARESEADARAGK